MDEGKVSRLPTLALGRHGLLPRVGLSLPSPPAFRARFDSKQLWTQVTPILSTKNIFLKE